MNRYRLSLALVLIAVLLTTAGCQKKPAPATADETPTTSTAVATTEDPNLPVKTQEEIQAILKDLNFEELTQDLSKLKRKSSILQKLESHKTASKQFIANIFYGTDEKKMYLFPDQVLPEEYDPTTRPWYTGAQNSAPYISEIYEDHYSKQYIITFAVPVITEGSVKGVVGIDVIIGTNGVGTPAAN